MRRGERKETVPQCHPGVAEGTRGTNCAPFCRVDEMIASVGAFFPAQPLTGKSATALRPRFGGAVARPRPGGLGQSHLTVEWLPH